MELAITAIRRYDFIGLEFNSSRCDLVSNRRRSNMTIVLSRTVSQSQSQSQLKVTQFQPCQENPV